MRIDQIGADLVHQLAGRLVRRVIAGVIVLLAALAALYQFTVAGTFALEMSYGAINAHLIVGGVYVALALIAAATLWSMRRKPMIGRAAPAVAGREMQFVMLAEALMLGYTLARKNERNR